MLKTALWISFFVLGFGVLAYAVSVGWPDRARAVYAVTMEQTRVEPCPDEPVGLHLAYRQHVAEAARNAIPETAETGVSFHLRQRADDRILFLDVEGSPRQPLADLAQRWTARLRSQLERDAARELAAHPPHQRACLDTRLIRLSPTPETENEKIPETTPPWWSIVAALGSVAYLSLRKRSHHD